MASWDELLGKAARTPMSDDEKAKQRLSFAYGNTHIENADISRQLIDEEAARIDAEGRDDRRS